MSGRQSSGVIAIPGRFTIPYDDVGRWLYASALVGFGLVGIATADFVNSLQPMPSLGVMQAPLAFGNGLVLVAAGACIAHGRFARYAGFLLAAFLATWVIALHIPSAFTNPELLRSPWWIRTFETLALGGTALVIAGTIQRPLQPDWVRIGRIAFGVSLPVFGVLHFVYADNVASLIPEWYPARLFLAYLTGAGHIAAGVAIASGRMIMPAAICAGFMYAIWAITLHLPRVIDLPPVTAGMRAEVTSLFVCVGFWGAAWVMAGATRSREVSAPL